MNTSILIVDDHGVLRAGLRALLNSEPGMKVVGETGNGNQVLDIVETRNPNIVLLDISLPDISGIEVTRQLNQRYPQVKVLILTIHEDTSLLREAIQAGAKGYILKRAVEAELIEAINVVVNGGLYIHPAMTRTLLEARHPKQVKTPEATLTQREIEIIRLLAKGYTNRQIAENLSLSIRTVETHRANIMSKLHLSSRVELVQYVSEHGLG